MTSKSDLEGTSEMQQNWNKIERNFKKIGIRDGISDGRNNNFQKYFDEGYYEGFHVGYVIGVYKGALFTELNQVENKQNDLLSEPKKGWCQICLNNELLSGSTSEVIAAQTETSNKNLQHLHSSYSKKCNVKLPIQLNSD